MNTLGLLLILLIVLFTLIVTGCSVSVNSPLLQNPTETRTTTEPSQNMNDGTQPQITDPIVGSWMFKDQYNKIAFSFYSDGSFNIYIPGDDYYPGKWQKVDDGRYKTTFDTSTPYFTIDNKKYKVDNPLYPTVEYGYLFVYLSEADGKIRFTRN